MHRPHGDKDHAPAAVRPRSARPAPAEPSSPAPEPARRPARPDPARGDVLRAESAATPVESAREAPPTVVTVTIGRIEIKAAPTSRAGGGGAPAPRTGPTLAEYLSGGRRGGTP